MITLQKLERLPRYQRLRKIAKLFTEAEYRLSLGETPALEIAYLRDIMALLLRDDSFSPAARHALSAAEASLGAEELPVRGLNTVRHILRAETGQQTADWDFIDHGGKLDPKNRRSFPGMLVYLDDIRSPYNVGAMFRTAARYSRVLAGTRPLAMLPSPAL